MYQASAVANVEGMLGTECGIKIANSKRGILNHTVTQSSTRSFSKNCFIKCYFCSNNCPKQVAKKPNNEAKMAKKVRMEVSIYAYNALTGYVQMLLDGVLQMFAVEVRINLGCEDALVAEQLLHLSYARTAFQQMRGK